MNDSMTITFFYSHLSPPTGVTMLLINLYLKCLVTSKCVI